LVWTAIGVTAKIFPLPSKRPTTIYIICNKWWIKKSHAVKILFHCLFLLPQQTFHNILPGPLGSSNIDTIK
jgi:hypothetical protein